MKCWKAATIAASFLGGSFAHESTRKNQWSQDELDAKWGQDWGYSGINTFAHLPHTRCLQAPDEEYDIAILGAPFDTAVTYRPGARFGPRAIRTASQRMTAFRGYNPRAGINPYMSWARVIDCGDIPITPFDNALALVQMSEAFTNLAHYQAPKHNRESSIDYRNRPKLLTLGGDHSIALPTLRALHSIYGQVAVVHFDAHLDTWHPAKYPSAWIDPDDPTQPSFFTHGTMFWLAHNESLIAKDKSVHAGLRTRLSSEEDNEEDTAQGWIRISTDDIDDMGVEAIAKKIVAHVGTEIPVYLSIDIDVIDPGLAPGTGTPEPGGWSTREVIRILRRIESLNVVAADIVEVSPSYDGTGEVTALAAAQLAFEVLTSMVKKGIAPDTVQTKDELPCHEHIRHIATMANNGDNRNRLQLNFGFGNQQSFTSEQARAYPTTPSTFPQPFPNAAGQQEIWGAQTPQSGMNQQGYFSNFNPYQSQYGAGLASPPPVAGYRGQQGGFNEVTNGFAQQMNLGGNTPRSASPYHRGATPNGKPRAGGAGGQQASYLGSPAQPNIYDDEPMPKNPEKYSSAITERVRHQKLLTGEFFKENVERAKNRNERALDLKKILESTELSDSRKEQKKNTMRKSEANFLRFLRTTERPQNYQTLKIIGKGAFGEVKLVQRKQDGKIYALKSLIKSEMHKKDQLAHVRAERDILANADSPWLVKLHTSFQDSTFLYMLMEFLPGGDLMTMLIKYEVFSEDITRFYMAEITNSIEAVHKLGFIHRDIKPDNILLDRGGHVKLTDFGLSTGFSKEHSASYYQQLMAPNRPKSIQQNRNSVSLDQIQLTVSNRKEINTWRKSRRQLAFSTVGTPDYIAPEIFSGRGYDKGCDWWSVGTIMFECLIGWPPFCAEEPHDTYRKIVDWPRHLHFPPDHNLTPESEHFIRGLICDPQNRLGRDRGATELKEHPFFNGVDWNSLRKVRAPFEPKLQSNVDTTYFPIDEIPQVDNSAQLRAQAEASGQADDPTISLPFIGYTYKRFDAFRGN